MITRKFYLNSLNAEAAACALDILHRFGWDCSPLDENGAIWITLSPEDEVLLDFLEMCWQ